MIVLSSPHLRRTYSFREIEKQESFLAKKTNLILARDADHRYITEGSWKNTPDQIRQIIDYPESALQICEL